MGGSAAPNTPMCSCQGPFPTLGAPQASQRSPARSEDAGEAHGAAEVAELAEVHAVVGGHDVEDEVPFGGEEGEHLGAVVGGFEGGGVGFAQGGVEVILCFFEHGEEDVAGGVGGRVGVGDGVAAVAGVPVFGERGGFSEDAGDGAADGGEVSELPGGVIGEAGELGAELVVGDVGDEALEYFGVGGGVVDEEVEHGLFLYRMIGPELDRVACDGVRSSGSRGTKQGFDGGEGVGGGVGEVGLGEDKGTLEGDDDEAGELARRRGGGEFAGFDGFDEYLCEEGFEFFEHVGGDVFYVRIVGRELRDRVGHETAIR